MIKRLLAVLVLMGIVVGAVVPALLNSYWLDSETSSWYYYSAWYIKTHVQDAYNGIRSWQSVKAEFESTYD